MKDLKDSILYPIVEQVASSSDFEVTKTLILEHLDKQKLKGMAARNLAHMKVTIQQDIHDHKKLLFWFYNNLQAYNGCKVVQPIPR